MCHVGSHPLLKGQHCKSWTISERQACQKRAMGDQCFCILLLLAANNRQFILTEKINSPALAPLLVKLTPRSHPQLPPRLPGLNGRRSLSPNTLFSDSSLFKCTCPWTDNLLSRVLVSCFYFALCPHPTVLDSKFRESKE